MIASPSCEATQPPTPMITSLPPASRRACLSRRQRPSWLNTFSWAFSRIEQVLTRITSAWAGSSVSSRPSCSASTSAMRAESYSFIWQPWVLMNNLPRAPPGIGRGPAPGSGTRAGEGAGEAMAASGVWPGVAFIPVMAVNPVGWNRQV